MCTFNKVAQATTWILWIILGAIGVYNVNTWFSPDPEDFERSPAWVNFCHRQANKIRRLALGSHQRMDARRLIAYRDHLKTLGGMRFSDECNDCPALIAYSQGNGRLSPGEIGIKIDEHGFMPITEDDYIRRFTSDWNGYANHNATALIWNGESIGLAIDSRFVPLTERDQLLLRVR